MARLTIADLIVETLAAAAVKRIYGVVGDSLNGLSDALRRYGTIEWMHMRHEEAAAFAAGAEAHLTGELAVCAGSCGPGNLHLINGLFDCHRSRVPVLAIAAHIPSAEIGGGYFQETHPQNLFAECSHFCEMVGSAEQMPRLLDIAIRTAIGQRGVAVLVIPGDIALQQVERPPAGRWLKPVPPVVVPQPDQLASLATLLDGAERVTILAGAGCAGAHDEVVALADALQAPIVHALRGKEHVEWDNPFDVGMTGLIGFASGYHAMEACDALLMLGTDFPYRQFYPTDAKIAQIDIRPEQLGRRCRLDLGLVGDVKATAAALRPLLRSGRSDDFLHKARANYVAARKDLDKLATGRAGSRPVHPQYLARLISDIADEDAIFALDVGTPTAWGVRYLKMNGKRRILGSFVHGSMANAMLQAIGAQAACPGRQVVTLSGDGGFSMMMGDILTLTQLRLPVKLVVFNNGTLGFVDLEMKASGFLPTGVDLANPNFAAMAQAIGMHGVRVEDPAELEPALRAAFAHDGPVLVDVVVNRNDLIMPPKATLTQAKGFSLWMLKAVLNGEGNTVVEVARTNLLR